MIKIYKLNELNEHLKERILEDRAEEIKCNYYDYTIASDNALDSINEDFNEKYGVYFDNLYYDSDYAGGAVWDAKIEIRNWYSEDIAILSKVYLSEKEEWEKWEKFYTLEKMEKVKKGLYLYYHDSEEKQNWKREHQERYLMKHDKDFKKYRLEIVTGLKDVFDIFYDYIQNEIENIEIELEEIKEMVLKDLADETAQNHNNLYAELIESDAIYHAEEYFEEENIFFDIDGNEIDLWGVAIKYDKLYGYYIEEEDETQEKGA